MSKSRYAKTKAAGAAIGLTRQEKMVGQRAGGLAPVENRQMRRLRKRSGEKS